MTKIYTVFIFLSFLPVYLLAQKEATETLECRTKGLNGAQVKKIEAIMKPIRLQVEKVLTTENPELYKQYKKDLELFLKLKDTKSKKDAVHQLEDKYYKYFRTCYTKANINEKAARDSIAKIIPHDIPYTFGEFLAIRSTSRKSPTIGSRTADDCPALSCPLDVNATKKTGNLSVWGDVFIKNCDINTFCTGGTAGNADFLGLTGQKAQFPEGTPDQTITAIVDMNMWIQAGAAIGGTYTESELGLKIKGPTFDKRYVDYSLWAIAPVVWFTYQADNALKYEITTSMTPDAKGGIYLLQVYARSFCVTGAAGFTSIETIIPKIHAIRMCQK